MVHLAGVAGLHDQTHLGAGPGADEVVVDRRNRQQRRDRCQGLVGLPVGDDQDPRTVGDGLRRGVADVVERAAQTLTTLGDGGTDIG